MTIKGASRKPSLLTLLLLISLASAAAVLNTPAMPAMMQYFQVDVSSIRWVVTIFILAYAMAPLIYGPITHRFGRKKTIYGGIGLGGAGMILCFLSAPTHNFSLLLLGRFIQGLGTGVGLVLAVTIINDVYHGVEARRISSYTALSFAIFPGIGVFLGGVLVHYFNWQSAFYFWLGYSVLMLYLVSRLPETSQHIDLQALNIKNIAQRYWVAFRDKRLISYAFLWGCSTSIVYLFTADLPLIVIKQLHIAPNIFGLVNLLTYLGTFVGNLIAAKLAGRFAGRTLISVGLISALLASLVLVGGYQLGYLNLWIIYGTGALIFMSLSLVFTNAMALAAAHLDNRVTASAVMSFINMGLAVLVLFLSGLFSFALATVFTMSCVVLLVIGILVSALIPR